MSPQNFDQPSYNDSLGHQFVKDLLHNDLPLIARPVSDSLGHQVVQDLLYNNLPLIARPASDSLGH